MSYSRQTFDELADDSRFERILRQLEQEWPIREHVSTALKDANAAFAAQCTDPDGYTFTAACDELVRFLDLGIALELSEQKLLMQVLQVALAMHENAVNNPMLTPTQRSTHYLATTALLPLCRCALDKSITNTDVWCHTFRLVCRAEQAHIKATEELNLSKYFDFENMQYDPFSGSKEDKRAADQANPPLVATASPASASTNAEPDEPRPESAQTTPSTNHLKAKALAMLNASPSGKTAPLGRCHTAPTLGSRVSAGRMTTNARPRACALQVLQEGEE